MKWENTTNEAVLHAARVEIARSAARNEGISLPHNMAPTEVAAALKQYTPPTLTHLLAVDQFRLRRNAWGLRRTPAT